MLATVPATQAPRRTNHAPIHAETPKRPVASGCTAVPAGDDPTTLAVAVGHVVAPRRARRGRTVGHEAPQGVHEAPQQPRAAL